MKDFDKSMIIKRTVFLLLLILICIEGPAGCRKNDPGTYSEMTVTGGANTPTGIDALPGTEVPTAIPSGNPTPTPSPTPTPEPWRSYEKICDRDVYRVPVNEMTDGAQIINSSSAGEYVLLQLWTSDNNYHDPNDSSNSNDPNGSSNEIVTGDYYHDPDDSSSETDTGDYDTDNTGSIGPENGRLLLLRPALSGETVSFQPDLPIRFQKVLADGTVFLVESLSETIHVFDSSFNETKTIAADENAHLSVLSVTEEGEVWRFDDEKKVLSVCDRNGENAVTFNTGDFGSVYQDLGGKDGKRYFIAMESDDHLSDVILCVDRAAGTVTPVEVEIFNVTTGSRPDYYPTVNSILYDYSDETWFLHLLSGNGDLIAFPHHFQYESIDLADNDRFCVSGYLRTTDGDETLWNRPRGCRVYDLSERVVLGELSIPDIAPYKSFYIVGMQENGLVFLVAGTNTGNEDILLWNVNDGMPLPLTGYCDLTEETPEGCLSKLTEEYRQLYGISYNPSAMKTVTYDENAEILRRIDFLNMLANGIANNPEEFPKDAEGIAVHLENVSGHERGHAQFNPHIFSEMSKSFYGEKQEQAFYRMIDAIRAGEQYFECDDGDIYNWCVGRLAVWFYPVTKGCIVSSYDYRDDEWKNGRGKIHYAVPAEEAAAIVSDFETRVCDILDDCISDDYNDFEIALALYEYITTNWTYDYDLYEHLNDPDWADVDSVYRCLMDKKGICWEIAGTYNYLLLQCGVNAEDAQGFCENLGESHAWTYLTLDGQGYNVDPTWGLDKTGTPPLKYFCFTDSEREERDDFPFDTCMVLGTDEMMRKKHSILADDERYARLWDGEYIGMDRSAKKVIYRDDAGMFHCFGYGD
ncbi:MAG: transglutaminase-like domain-containing protein [Lachnospiraceae bacterium]|nr:transglutaminase-like domain-containing protein [Lachnospiraceae bacterium]